MIPVLLIAAVAYWLAAPDAATAGARTAAGTAARAAGAGARSHWAAGRDGRKLGRTDRRDRWSRSGGFWRNLLRLEHGAVIGGKAAKGAGKLTAAAVRPVPGAVRAGWVQGRDRHRAKAGDRHRGLVLDPPWWNREQPQVQAGEQAPEQVQVQGGEQAGGSPEEQAPSSARGHDLPPEFKPGDRLVDGTGKAWTVRGVRPQIDADTYDLVDDNGAPGYADIPRPDRWEAITEQDDPTDPPTGTSPDGATPTTEGDPMSYTGIDELDNLTSVKDMAKLVADMAEESDFAQLVEFCKNASDETRDFGSDMAGDVAEFEEIAAKIGDLLAELADAAQKVDSRADELIGG